MTTHVAASLELLRRHGTGSSVHRFQWQSGNWPGKSGNSTVDESQLASDP